MIKVEAYIEKIKGFCDFYIEYDESNKTYRFNTIFIDEINCESFQTDMEGLKNELIDVLIDLKDPSKYINDVLQEINKIAIWYETEKIYEFENFSKLSKIIAFSKENTISVSKSKYTLDSIKNSPEELDYYQDDILYYLILHKSKTDNYRLEDDFEKVKLHHVLTKYFESIYSLIEYLLMLDEIITKYGIEDYNQFRPIPKQHLRCTVNLSKIETANLFNVFYQCGYFSFGMKSNKKEEKAQMEFIENNFNYINQHGKIANVSKINKEFIEINTHAHIEHQKKVIDLLIDKLKEIKGTIRIR